MANLIAPELPVVDTRRKDAEAIPLAVQMEGQLPQLLKLDLRKPLAETVSEVAQAFGVTDSSNYALQFDSEVHSGAYVTEINRKDVQKGTILVLTDSPSKSAQDLYNKLHSQNPQEISDAFKKLAKSACDITFATEFIDKNGHELLIHMVEKGTEHGDSLGDTLTAFLELMEHAILSWDVVTPGFVKRISSYVSGKPLTSDLRLVILKSFAILESIILHSTSLFDSIANEVTFHGISQHLDGMYPDLQQSCLALMNALCMKAPPGRRRRLEETLASRETRINVLEKVVRSPNMGTELNHQMYVFQQLTFNLLESRMMMKMEAGNEIHRGLIVDLRNAAFGTVTDPMQPYQTNTAEYQKLGFQSTSNPTLDFQDVPPGILALECMHHFALKDNHDTKLVFEYTTGADEHKYPFVKTSIALTKVLCEVLKVGETPSETCADYHPMFFASDKSFEEFFCQSIKLFNKTWKEMRASTLEDFPKVMEVVREQIERAMKDGPRKPVNMEQFWAQVQQLNYDKIVRLREKERSDKEELYSKSPPVVELREKIKPEIIELIKSQRLKSLIEGTKFNKFSKAGRLKDRYWYCRLSPNKKILHYGDIQGDTSEIPSAESLLNKVEISDDVALVTGHDCHHAKGANLAFSLVQFHNSESLLDFVASDQEIFDMWTDGLNAALGKPMVSEQMQADLDMLLSMEMKIRLLNIVSASIPLEPPPIPPPPPIEFSRPAVVANGS